MFHHPLFQNGLNIHLKIQTVRDSGLPSILRHTPTLLRNLQLWWNGLWGLIPWEQLLFLKDWADLFGNFEDLINELVKEFYSNARFTGVELKCWVQGKEFIITPNYIAEVLQITRTANVDPTPYDDKLPQVQDILQILGPDHEISSKGTSIGTTKFALDLTTLKLIMFFNLYPLSNTGFINLGKVQFLCDLITRVQIDISAHIFQLIGRTTA